MADHDAPPDSTDPAARRAPDVGGLCTVVVTTYRRSDLAVGCVRRLREVLPDGVEILVSDDGSGEDHEEVLRSIEGITLLLGSDNGGLGANINRALAAVRTPFALWVQDDMWPARDVEGSFLDAAVEVLASWPAVDVVRLLVPYRLAVAEHRRVGPWRVARYSHSILRNGRRFASVYSDNPHVRRIDLVGRIGPYREMAGHGNTETEYAFRCLRHRVGVASVAGWERCFEHVGDDRSTQSPTGRRRSRARWRSTASAAKLLVAYGAYRITGRFPDGLYRSRVSASGPSSGGTRGGR